MPTPRRSVSEKSRQTRTRLRRKLEEAHATLGTAALKAQSKAESMVRKTRAQQAASQERVKKSRAAAATAVERAKDRIAQAKLRQIAVQEAHGALKQAVREKQAATRNLLAKKKKRRRIVVTVIEE